MALSSLLALAALSACTAPAADTGDPSALAPSLGVTPKIVNGTRSTAANDSVVYLRLAEGLCSGTLLAPNLVLTARHCVASMDQSTDCGAFGPSTTPSSITVSVGANADGSEVAATGKRIFTETEDSMCGFDVALILLDKDVAGATVAKIRLGAVGVGETALAVGYGEGGTGEKIFGRFERGNLSVDAVGPSTLSFQLSSGKTIPVKIPAGEIVTGESTCFGDSGGPLFDSESAVIGVTSRGIDESCIDRPSIFSATAAHAPLIREAARASGHALLEPGSAPPAEAEATPKVGAKDEGDDEEAAPSKTKPTVTAPVQSASCTTSPRTASGPHASLLATAFGVALLLSARRRRQRP